MHVTPLFGIPLFKDILRIHVNESYYKVMKYIIRQALNTFEKRRPLYLYGNIYMTSNEYTFTDNTELVKSGKLSEHRWTLIPEQVINLSGTMVTMYRNFTYDRPTLRLNYPATGEARVYYMARRPVLLEKNPVEDEFTPESCIYGLSLYGDYITEQFMKELMFTLINYLIELKSQVNYAEIPIDFMSGLQDKRSELNDELEQFYNNPVSYAKLWR